jgi:hypothetical protein
MLADADTRQRCFDTQLGLLREDFGVNLKSLTSRERIGLDAACRRFENTHGRDFYLDCVNTQLVALRLKRTKPAAAPAAAASAAATTANTAAASTTSAASTQAQDAAASNASTPANASASTTPGSVPASVPAIVATSGPTSSTTIVGIVLLVVASIAAGSLVLLRKRRVRRTCRQCGAVSEGELCAACRRAAAEAMRRAASERMEQMRAEEAERKRRLQLEQEERRQQALREEEARANALEDARRRDEQERLRRDEEERQQRQRVAAAAPARPASDEFDPYAVLGIGRDTTREDLRAAYERARSKYDEDAVAHLGVDVQEHYREKALAVDRAYQMLAG